MEFQSIKLNSKLTVAIVVTYNPEMNDFNLFCNKLLKQFYNVIIVDNNSTNIDLIYSKFSDNNSIKFIKNSTNCGLAIAQNQGIHYAIQNQVQSFCIFDQDSHIEDGYLEILINDYNKLIDGKKRIASIGPVIVDQTTCEDYPAPVYNGMFLSRKILKPNEIQNCSYIIASGSLYETKTFQDVGMFNDRFFINYIDVEWCFRALALGYEIYMTSNCKLVQNVGLFRKKFFGRSIPVHNPIRRYYATRNSILMIFLPHVSIGYKIREFFFNPLRLIFDCLVAGNSKQRISLFFKGYADGIKNK